MSAAADDQLVALARVFYGNEQNRGHAERLPVEEALEGMRAALVAAHPIASRALGVTSRDGLHVLDVGCSWGCLAFAVATQSRTASVVGLDLEKEALDLGLAVKASQLVDTTISEKVSFVQGSSEGLPFADGTFDVIVCNTVIEHVLDVERSLDEMYRVLKPGGALYLYAPNYLWPREPHLGIWIPPLGPKWVVKAIARLATKDPSFVDHLQFVHPFRLERFFRRRGMRFTNLYTRRIREILVEQRYEKIMGRTGRVPLLRLLHRVGAAGPITAALSRLGLYPAIEYGVHKAS
jgi:2-polyprenyl-3-methyl-5-hydroxy-6-metoxy-1,4-benzoquinol methylase